MGITIFGPAAFFTSITYIARMMIEEAGFSDAGVAWLMVLFGLGLAVGNWAGGRFADRSLFGTLFVTLAAQAAVHSSGRPAQILWSAVKLKAPTNNIQIGLSRKVVKIPADKKQSTNAAIPPAIVCIKR